MSIDDELRAELDLVAEAAQPPVIALARLERLAEKERLRRRGVVAGGVAAVLLVLIAAVPLTLGLRSPPRGFAPTSPSGSATATATATASGGLSAGDLDGDGLPDEVVLDGQRVQVVLGSGTTLTWHGRGHGDFDVLGPARFGQGRVGLVLVGYTPDGGNDSAVVLLVRGGVLVRANPGSTSLDRQNDGIIVTQTVWVERGQFLNAVCGCSPGSQPVDVYRLLLAANGTTLVGVGDRRGCWDPTSGRDPDLAPC